MNTMYKDHKLVKMLLGQRQSFPVFSVPGLALVSLILSGCSSQYYIRDTDG